MHRRTRTALSPTLAIKAHLAAQDLRDRTLGAVTRRVRGDGEEGAQVAEYAMLGGVSAAACGGLIALLKDEDFLRRILDGVVTGLLRAVTSWF